MVEIRQVVEKLAIGYPWSSPFIWTPFTLNLANLERPANSRIFQGQGWCPARRHIHICEQSIDYEASHILIIGSDQIHPHDMIPRLIDRVENDGCDVISALVPTRGHIPRMKMEPFSPMAWRLSDDGKDSTIIKPENGDLQKIDFIGSGVIMFPVSCLLAIEKPWFKETYELSTMGRISCMDTNFCWELKTKAGADVWVDTTIDVKHLSTFAIDRTYSDRFQDFKDLSRDELKMIDIPYVDRSDEVFKKIEVK